MKPYTFKYDDRLGIKLPQLNMEWSALSLGEREAILTQWEQIRGTIPERIKQFEHQINTKQDQLGKEFDFPASCRINWEIAELASRINDLHLWFRKNQELVEGKSHR
jgi:hypothetical protein